VLLYSPPDEKNVSSPPITRISLPRADELVYRVDPNLSASITVKNYLNRLSTPPERLEKVSVTKLVNPGQAYYDVVNPLPEELGAFQKRMAGTGAHDRIESMLELPAEYWLDGTDVPGEPALDRITAKLDSYVPLADGRYMPVEIKNVNSPKARPSSSHMEQLGMYCALLETNEGMILRVYRNDATGESSMLAPIEIHYPDLDQIRREMVTRRDLLTEAVRLRDPSKLPACSWVGYKCKYKEAGICSCEERPPLDPVIARNATWKEAPEFLESVEKHQRERSESREKVHSLETLSFYQLTTPRKVFFESLAAGEENVEDKEAPGNEKETRAVDKEIAPVNRRGLEAQIYVAVKGANRSRIAQAEPVIPELRGRLLTTLDGNPFLVKVRMVNNPIRTSVAEVTGQWGVPDDIKGLAMRAALLGAKGGRIYVWNWKLKEESQKMQVFDIKFSTEKLASVEEYVRGMPERLRKAIADSDHRGLPICPDWMCPKCPFHERCQPEQG
jgi:CRISPR/Cas system-associated exonuclease Cas4 (RecB family)